MLPVILALDTKDLDLASKWIKSSADQIDHFKVGLEFYLLHGFEGIKKLQQVANFKLFLDLKLYDIPNTVKGAVESVSNLNPKFLTVHASGGSKMIQEASKALPNGLITAVICFMVKVLGCNGKAPNQARNLLVIGYRQSLPKLRWVMRIPTGD